MLITLLICVAIVKADYWEDRAAFLAKDASFAIGANLELTPLEKKVNEILMNFKLKEYDEGFAEPSSFLASKHFFHAKSLIEKTDVFKIIQKLPKGATLHIHDTAMVSNDFLFNLTYKTNLYGCTKNGEFKMKFFEETPDYICDWKTLKELRENDPNFNENLRKKMSLVVPDPIKTYPTINDVWNKFLNIFIFIDDLITYKPIFKEYFYQALKELYDDNVKYVEFRTILPPLYENGITLEPIETAAVYNETLHEFKRDYPGFVGARLIYAPLRGVDNATMDSYMKIAREVKREFPDLVAGFDLVGQEDLGNTLDDFLPNLQNISQEMNVFFHAGETDWYGSSTDFNIFDAILLGTKRIGHGYSLVKHPAVINVVKKKDIGIEVSPISNQVLMLVQDLRNHPGTILMSHGLPVIICNDDPGMWGSIGLSYDWYLAFMAMASRNSDLRFLKQLALNAINYSSMATEEKKYALRRWQHDWEHFLMNIRNVYENVIV